MSGLYRSPSRLEHILRQGLFAVTAELSPPDSADPEEVYRLAEYLAGTADAINATDSSGANCHMASLAVCTLLRRLGYDTVMQISCRDRNRIAMQGDILGTAALGVSNILCLTGDDVTVGDHPQAKRVFDLDSIQLLRMARTMRDEGVFLSGRPLSVPPALFLGAAANPFAPPFEWRVGRLAKKIAAGADFIQTQYCFDVPRFRWYMQRVRDLGLHEQVFILAGVGPLRSLRMAEFLRTKVPGIHVPDKLLARMQKTPKGQQQQEGKQICVEIIEQIKQIEGVSGIHIMAYRQEELVPQIVEEAGLLPRPFPVEVAAAAREALPAPAIRGSQDTLADRPLPEAAYRPVHVRRKMEEEGTV